MDPSIKQYADSLYEKSLFESGATVRRESTKYLQERSKTQNHTQLFSGTNYQAQIRIYADHIEFSTAARLDAYQKAFNEINRPPIEDELGEILEDFKGTWELQIKHSNQALSNFLAARNAPAGLDSNVLVVLENRQGTRDMAGESPCRTCLPFALGLDCVVLRAVVFRTHLPTDFVLLGRREAVECCIY